MRLCMSIKTRKDIYSEKNVECRLPPCPILTISIIFLLRSTTVQSLTQLLDSSAANSQNMYLIGEILGQ